MFAKYVVIKLLLGENEMAVALCSLRSLMAFLAFFSQHPSRSGESKLNFEQDGREDNIEYFKHLQFISSTAAAAETADAS